MADAKARQVREAMRTLLAGATFQGLSGVQAVFRVVNLPASEEGFERMLDMSVDGALIGMAPDVETDTRLTYTEMGVEMPIDLVVACKFLTPETDPFNPPPLTRWDYQDELARAVKDRIRSDLKLGGLALDITIPDTDKSAENTFVDNWAAVILRTVVMFQHPETSA